MLDAILANTRAEVARRRSEVSLESLLARCRPSDRRLGGALRGGRPGFLLEIKFASPSGGTIRTGADLDPILDSYSRHADAVSVLTDRKFFGGSLERLAQVRARLGQPLLCKDFILEPYQVAEARAAGADAILLILAAIDDPTWRGCADLAGRLGMEVLTEVHDPGEARRAVALGAGLIGINARDLRTLGVDPGTPARVAPLIPADRLVVAESGIESREQVAALRPWCDAVLVGTAVMREANLDAAVRGLVYGRTKICGITRGGDAAAARAAGATHGGLVFAAGSPRRISLDQALAVRETEPLAWVGVFVDPDPEEVGRIARRLRLSAVQLHGQESATTVARVRSLMPEGCEVWKACAVRGGVPSRAESGADRLLLDAARPPGQAPQAGDGTGRSFDWSLLEGYPERDHIVLAGGLDAGNVARAAALLTWGLDASSGLESAPGRKDPRRLAEFFSERRRLPGRGDSRP